MKLAKKLPWQMTCEDHKPEYKVNYCGHRCAARMSWRQIKQAMKTGRATKNGRRIQNGQYGWSR
jgi:hypothetical protein